MATDKSVQLEVRGLVELTSALKKVDADVASNLKAAMKAIAADVVAIAQEQVIADVGAGPAASSIRPRASLRGAAVAFGGPSAPYYPWLDFGGSVGRGHKPRVAWSGAIKRAWKGKPNGDGRYVYPAIRQEGPEIGRKAREAVEDAKRSGGWGG